LQPTAAAATATSATTDVTSSVTTALLLCMTLTCPVTSILMGQKLLGGRGWMSQYGITVVTTNDI